MICRKIVPFGEEPSKPAAAGFGAFFAGGRWMCIGIEVRNLDDFVL